jgi:hypothetical protein
MAPNPLIQAGVSEATPPPQRPSPAQFSLAVETAMGNLHTRCATLVKLSDIMTPAEIFTTMQVLFDTAERLELTARKILSYPTV